MLNTPLYFEMYRNSLSQMLFKIGFLKNFTIFTAKHLRWRLSRPTTLSKKDSNAGVFLWILRNLKNSHFYRAPLVAAWRVITLKETVASAAFLRCSFRKIFLNSWSIGRRISTAVSDLSRVAPAALLWSISVMDDFLQILQGFN